MPTNLSYLNTSNVDIKLSNSISTFPLSSNLNTSNVDIKHLIQHHFHLYMSI